MYTVFGTMDSSNIEMHHKGVYMISHTSPDSGMGTDVKSTREETSDGKSEREEQLSPNDVELSVPLNLDHSKPFRGMGKEELLKYSSRPFWRRLRMTCISIILIGWLVLLFTVIALVLIYPRCRDPESRDWWQSSVLYRVYVRSFLDSDGDGIGDLKGLESRLDYLSSIGVGVISLSPVYLTGSQNDDFDIVDHKQIDPDFGNLTDFEFLVKSAHEKGMYVIMDFIPNHTSDMHPWFEKSSSSRTRSNEERNYYVWSNIDNPPTNWLSIYDESMWTFSQDRNESYLHQFRSQQPDLNLRSSLVQKELEDILEFWMDIGVDGFYVRDSGFLFEDFDLRNEIHDSMNDISDSKMYNYYEHEYTHGLPETFDMFARWRTFLSDYSNTTDKILMADIDGAVSSTMDYYGHFGRDGVQLPRNTYLLEKTGSCDGTCVYDYVDMWMNNLPEGKWANWVMGDDNSERFSSRFSANYSRPMMMLTMLLPGTPLVYYGDEIGIENNAVPVDNWKWSREQKSRGLMQWENRTWGGFQDENGCPVNGCVDPWISSNDEYEYNNVEAQEAASGSLLNFFKDLTSLRKLPSFRIGEYHASRKDSSIFSFVREFDGETGYLVAINFGQSQETRNFEGRLETIPEEATVVLTSGQSGRYNVDDEISTNGVTLDPLAGLVLSWSYQVKEL